MSSSCIEEVSVPNDDWYRIAAELLGRAGIEINGSAPSDLRVKNPLFFKRVLQEGSLGLGESYMDGWWDCAAVSLRAIDQNGNLLPYCGEAVQLSVEGPLRILGPSVVPLRGGMAGTYLATTGEAGPARLRCRMEGALDTEASLTIRRREEERG